MNELKDFHSIKSLTRITVIALALAHLAYFFIFKFLEIDVLADLKLIEFGVAVIWIFFAFFTKKHYNLIIYYAHASILVSCALCTLMLGHGYGFIMMMLLTLSIGYVHNFKSSLYPILIGLIEFLFIIITLILTWNIPNYDSPYRIHVYIFNLFNMTCLIMFYSTFITKMSQKEEEEARKEKMELDKKINNDYLTQILNRNSMKKILNQYLNYFKQEKISSMTVALCNIDSFKKINNEFGCKFGDIVLKNTANILKNSLEGIKDSYVSRWGDKEFLIFLSDNSINENKCFLDNLKDLVANYTHTDGFSSKKITITIGMCYAAKLENIDTILSKAEEALYYGKVSGKNTVELMVVN